MPSVPNRPKLRKVERYAGSSADQLVLRDPLGLSAPIGLPSDAGPILDLFDGTRTIAQVRQSVRMRHGERLDAAGLDAFVDDLHHAGWLEGERFQELWAELLAAFLDAPARECVYDELLYPGETEQLRLHLAQCIPPAPRLSSSSSVVGVLAPHGPAPLVGDVLDSTLRELPTPEQIELVVVLGTDHGQGRLPFSVTAKPYVTPLGSTTPAGATIEALERRLPWVRREEIRHRQALSTELATIFLQHIYGPKLPPVVHVLCHPAGVQDEAHDDVQGFLLALEALTEDRAVLWWGSAELSHSGPAYGHPPLDDQSRAIVEAHDHACLDALSRHDAAGLASACRDGTPQGRPSGGAVMAAMASLLTTAKMNLVCYQRRSAPGSDHGEIGLAGVRFCRPAKRIRPA